MNWESWIQQRPLIQSQRQKLTNDDLDLINGDRSVLIEKLQERYGYDAEKAEQELHYFEDPTGDDDIDLKSQYHRLPLPKYFI